MSMGTRTGWIRISGILQTSIGSLGGSEGEKTSLRDVLPSHGSILMWMQPQRTRGGSEAKVSIYGPLQHLGNELLGGYLVRIFEFGVSRHYVL